MTDKRKLPTRREGYTQKVTIGGQALYLRTGNYPDGKLAEIFCTMQKEGTVERAFLNAFCIQVSKRLQHEGEGALEDMVETFVFSRFEPAGAVVGHDNIKRVDSILDFIFRDLAINYLGRDDLKHKEK